MRLEENPVLPFELKDLRATLGRLFMAFAMKVNQLADGRITAVDNALPAAPTTGQYRQGDFVRNSSPTELGSPGARYVVFGWICVAGGVPGTFRDMRFLTGN